MRLEGAGTARIEGAEFSDQEQDIALASQIPLHIDLTHSQRQLFTVTLEPGTRLVPLQPTTRT